MTAIKDVEAQMVLDGHWASDRHRHASPTLFFYSRHRFLYSSNDILYKSRCFSKASKLKSNILI